MKGEKGGLNMKKMFLDIWVPTNVTGGGSNNLYKGNES